MARYNTFKYGAQTYGVDTGAIDYDINFWSFLVDWDGDAVFGTSDDTGSTFNNEAMRMTGLTIRRGRDALILPGGDGLEHYRVGEAVAILDNSDRRYDPRNTSSPLYPNVKPGKFVQIKVRYRARGADPGSTRGVFHGVIEDIQPFNRGKEKFVRITCKDGLRWLRDRIIKKGLRSSVSINSNVLTCLNVADWPFDYWTSGLAASVGSLTYWWGWQVKALEAIHKLEQAEFGAFFHDRQGFARFKGRDFTYVTSFTITEDLLLDDISFPQPWHAVRNSATIYSYPKLLDAVNTTLWELQDVPALLDTETFEVDAIFKYSDWRPCGSSVTFNVTGNTLADGTGTNLNFDLTFNTDIGDGAEVTVTNNTGFDGFITLLRGVGDAIYPPYTNVRKASDATSQTDFGPRNIIVNTPWVEDSALAQDYADYLVAELKDPKLFPIIRLEDRPHLQFAPDIYLDRIVLQVDELDINSNFRIGGIEHEWLSENGVRVRTTFHLEPYLTVPTW